jgi:hypothetical protein
MSESVRSIYDIAEDIKFNLEIVDDLNDALNVYMQHIKDMEDKIASRMDMVNKLRMQAEENLSARNFTGTKSVGSIKFERAYIEMHHFGVYPALKVGWDRVESPSIEPEPPHPEEEEEEYEEEIIDEEVFDDEFEEEDA